MAEYIDREALIATVNGVWERIYDRCTYQPVHDVYRMIIKRINGAIASDVQEVKHGEWLSRCGTGQYDDYYCSLCGMYEEGTRNKDRLGNYCSWCGAKMDLGRY